MMQGIGTFVFSFLLFLPSFQQKIVGFHTQTLAQLQSFNLLVPESKIGRVIGKGGAGLERIRTETMCSITVQRSSSTNGDRTVELTGTAGQIQAAQSKVMHAIDDTVDASKRKLPTDFMSLHSQQQQHQRHLYDMFNPVPPAGSGMGEVGGGGVSAPQWGVSSYGPSSAHMGALGHFQAPPAFGHPHMQPHGGGVDELGPTRARILIDDKKAGCIIGKGAAGLAEIRGSSGAHFELGRHPLLLGQRLLVINPPYAAQERCIMLVCEKLAAAAALQAAAAVQQAAAAAAVTAAAAAAGGATEAAEPAAPPVVEHERPHITLKMIIPSALVGKVVEKGGSGLRSLREQGLYVNLPREDDPKPGERVLTLRGDGSTVGKGLCTVLTRLV
jgi:hypothetical protein